MEEEVPIKLSVYDVVNKAEEFYKNPELWIPPSTYEYGIKEMKDKILTVQRVAKEEFKMDLSIADVLQRLLESDTIKKIKQAAHITIIAGFKMEDEKQDTNKNVEDWEMMVRLVLEELTYFSLPPGSTVTVMSMKELDEALEKKATNWNLFSVNVGLIFLNSWIYYPLSFPFLVLKVIWLICVIIKPTVQQAKKIDMKKATSMEGIDFKNVNLNTILQEAEKRMPKIMDIDYYGHHIVCGILLWIIILKMIF